MIDSLYDEIHNRISKLVNEGITNGLLLDTDYDDRTEKEFEFDAEDMPVPGVCEKCPNKSCIIRAELFSLHIVNGIVLTVENCPLSKNKSNKEK